MLVGASPSSPASRQASDGRCAEQKETERGDCSQLPKEEVREKGSEAGDAETERGSMSGEMRERACCEMYV